MGPTVHAVDHGVGLTSEQLLSGHQRIGCDDGFFETSAGTPWEERGNAVQGDGLDLFDDLQKIFGFFHGRCIADQHCGFVVDAINFRLRDSAITIGSRGCRRNSANIGVHGLDLFEVDISPELMRGT